MNSTRAIGEQIMESQNDTPSMTEKKSVSDINLDFLFEVLKTRGYTSLFQVEISHEEAQAFINKGVVPLEQTNYPISDFFDGHSGRAMQNLLFMKMDEVDGQIQPRLYTIRYSTVSQQAVGHQLENYARTVMPVLIRRDSKFVYDIFLKYFPQQNSYKLEFRCAAHAKKGHPSLLINKVVVDGSKQEMLPKENKAIVAAGEIVTDLIDALFRKANNRSGHFYDKLLPLQLNNKEILLKFFEKCCTNPENIYEDYKKGHGLRRKKIGYLKRGNSCHLPNSTTIVSAQTTALKRAKSVDIQAPNVDENESEVSTNKTNGHELNIHQLNVTPVPAVHPFENNVSASLSMLSVFNSRPVRNTLDNKVETEQGRVVIKGAK